MSRLISSSWLIAWSANRTKYIIGGSLGGSSANARETSMVPTLYKQPVCLTFMSALFETPARISSGMDVAVVGVARDSGSKLHGG